MTSKRARCTAPVSPEPASLDDPAGAAPAPRSAGGPVERPRPGPFRRAVARAAAASRAAHGASVPF
jgi:hypothetical protein